MLSRDIRSGRVYSSLTIFAGLVALTAWSPAFAADKPIVKAPPAAYDWTGFYIGGHAGGSWSTTTFTDTAFPMQMNNCCVGASNVTNTSAGSDANASGFLGGAQVGAVQQIGHLAVGVDLDWSAANLKGSGAAVFANAFGNPSGSQVTEAYDVRTRWTATATTTLGLTHDRWMLYGKAGVALADNSYNLAINGTGNTTPFSFASSTSDLLVGWTVGTGVKLAIADAWFLNLEYDYMNFGSKAQNFAGTLSATPWSGGSFNPAANFTPEFYQSISEVKVGLNYRFGQGAGPGINAIPAYQGRLLTKAPPAMAYDWTGLYVGGHVGGGWSATSFIDPEFLMEMNNCCTGATILTDTVAGPQARGNGFLGGVQVGGLYQIGRLVVGSDFDWSAANMNGSGALDFPFANGNQNTFQTGTAIEAYGVDTKWTATATTTIGIAQDRWMFYSKAGAAWAHNTYSLTITGERQSNFGPPTPTPFSYASTTDDIVSGWTFGVGVKWAITDSWFLDAEYDYLAFGAKAENFAGTFTATPHSLGYSPNATFSPTFNQDISEIKVGLNYRLAQGLMLAGDPPPAASRMLVKATPVVGYDWTGVYAGGHIGGGWSTTTFSDPGFLTEINNCCIGQPGSSLSDTGSTSQSSNGSFLGGLQAGAMYQVGSVVAGWDLDWSDTSMKNSGSVSYPGAFAGNGSFATESYSARTNWTATATTTLGVARDRQLYYAKIGAALADNTYDLDVEGACGNTPCGLVAPAGDFSFLSRANDVRIGWTVGAGVKWAVTQNWFVNAEYDFMSFGSRAENMFGTFSATPWGGTTWNPNGSFTPTFHQAISELKVGVNYKFGPGVLLW